MVYGVNSQNQKNLKQGSNQMRDFLYCLAYLLGAGFCAWLLLGAI